MPSSHRLSSSLPSPAVIALCEFALFAIPFSVVQYAPTFFFGSLLVWFGVEIVRGRLSCREGSGVARWRRTCYLGELSCFTRMVPLCRRWTGCIAPTTSSRRQVDAAEHSAAPAVFVAAIRVTGKSRWCLTRFLPLLHNAAEYILLWATFACIMQWGLEMGIAAGVVM